MSFFLPNCLMPGVINQTGTATNILQPDDVAGLMFWFDASDITTLWQDDGRTTQVDTDGQSVGGWDDKSGNALHIIMPTAAKKPTYHSTGTYLSFDGGDGLEKLAAGVDMNPSTAIAVIQWSSGNGSILGGTGASHYVWYITEITGVQKLEAAAVTLVGNSNSTVTTNKAIIACTWDGTSAYAFRLNGADDGSGTNTVTVLANNDLRVGGQGTLGAYWPYTGNIMEVFAYDTVLSASEIQGIENGLNAKWSVY